ncbi:MAG: DNA polymerase IV [Planctomycetota bacterium]|nr:DNA polymerase IV [Planctomycetota bacterium]
MSDSPRKIVHVDMDAFYASVEQLDQASLRGKPVIVGGLPKSRGVVCAASYEARAFGVHSAMPSSQAFRLCPHAVFIRPNFQRYKELSSQIQTIFRNYTSLVEPLSLDEAYLDVTENNLGLSSATKVAQAIREEILQNTGLTASAGVAPNKFLAKIASDMDKPDGLFVISPKRIQEVLSQLPVRRIPGIGPVSEQRCLKKGIRIATDFLRHSPEQLEAWFGSAGPRYLSFAKGIDKRPVRPSRTRKSISVEDTFGEDISSLSQALSMLDKLSKKLEERLQRSKSSGYTLTLKVKYADFEQITRSRTVDWPILAHSDLMELSKELIGSTDIGQRPIRLLGLGLSQLGVKSQLVLPFDALDT